MEKIRVGWAAEDISPVESVPLAGYGNSEKRMSQNILHPLYAHCVALSDEDDNTVLVCAVDLVAVLPKLFAAIRAEVLAQTGIPGDRIIVSGTHTHSAPDLTNEAIASIPRYFDQIVKSMGRVAKRALEDRKAAKMYTGRLEFENMNFIRHYVFEDGTRSGYAGSVTGAGARVGHVCESDKEMQLVKFVREGGKDVVLVNWQGHPTFTGGQVKPNVSSDAVGVFRDKLSAALDCPVVYYTGASGNVNMQSRIPQEQIYTDIESYSDALVRGVLEAGDIFTEARTGKVRSIRSVYAGRVNHTCDHMAPLAERVDLVWRQTNDYKATNAVGIPLGIHSPYHAGAILGRKERGATYDLEQMAVVMGDLAFATAPYEMFKANGCFIKDNSPCPTTLILTCANGTVAYSSTMNVDYIPSADAFEYIGYETDTTTFEPGTAEEMADRLVVMLRELYERPC